MKTKKIFTCLAVALSATACFDEGNITPPDVENTFLYSTCATWKLAGSIDLKTGAMAKAHH